MHAAMRYKPGSAIVSTSIVVELKVPSTSKLLTKKERKRTIAVIKPLVMLVNVVGRVRGRYLEPIKKVIARPIFTLMGAWIVMIAGAGRNNSTASTKILGRDPHRSQLLMSMHFPSCMPVPHRDARGLHMPNVTKKLTTMFNIVMLIVPIRMIRQFMFCFPPKRRRYSISKLTCANATAGKYVKGMMKRNFFQVVIFPGSSAISRSSW